MGSCCVLPVRAREPRSVSLPRRAGKADHVAEGAKSSGQWISWGDVMRLSGVTIFGQAMCGSGNDSLRGAVLFGMWVMFFVLNRLH